jgi:hypothetical protein
VLTSNFALDTKLPELDAGVGLHRAQVNRDVNFDVKFEVKFGAKK